MPSYTSEIGSDVDSNHSGEVGAIPLRELTRLYAYAGNPNGKLDVAARHKAVLGTRIQHATEHHLGIVVSSKLQSTVTDPEQAFKVLGFVRH